MDDSEERRPHLYHSNETLLTSPLVASLPFLSLDRELTFWKKSVAGLTALAHNNCWAAARALVDIYTSIAQPLALTDAPNHTMTRAIAEATEIIATQITGEPQADRRDTSWPASQPDAQRWLARLIQGYQETIRFVWEHSHAHDDVSAPSYTLSRRCFALIETCIESESTADIYSGVVSWLPCSIVLPAYNEAENIGETMLQCVEALSRISPNFEVLVVDDGSQDATGVIADAAAADNASIIAVHNHPNQGYGGALLAGFAAAQGERIFFMDSDGQFDIREIAILLRVVESGESPIAVGYRAKRSDPFMRKLNAWGWKLAARHIVGLQGIRDIDCAFKLIPTDALRSCQIIAKGASINVEMLLKFQRMGLAIHQTPVRHMPRTRGSPTGAKLHVILRAFRELFHLRRHLLVWQPPRQVFPHSAAAHDQLREPARTLYRTR